MILATELDEGRKCFRLNRKPVLQVNSSTQVVSRMTLKELCDKAEHTAFSLLGGSTAERGRRRQYTNYGCLTGQSFH